jgi:hypothetical protein
MTTLMLLSTVRVQFIVAVEPLSTETALRMAFEPALINGTRVVIPKFLVLPKLGECEEFVFMGEDFLVPCTEIAGKVSI